MAIRNQNRQGGQQNQQNQQDEQQSQQQQQGSNQQSQQSQEPKMGNAKIQSNETNENRDISQRIAMSTGQPDRRGDDNGQGDVVDPENDCRLQENLFKDECQGQPNNNQ